MGMRVVGGTGGVGGGCGEGDEAVTGGGDRGEKDAVMGMRVVGGTGWGVDAVTGDEAVTGGGGGGPRGKGCGDGDEGGGGNWVGGGCGDGG